MTGPQSQAGAFFAPEAALKNELYEGPVAGFVRLMSTFRLFRSVSVSVGVAVALAVLGYPAVAHAEESAGPPSPDSGRASAAAPSAAPETRQEDGDDVRLRIGFNFNGGAIVTPGTVGGGGFAFRIGVQANHLLGVYYQVSPMVFAGFSVGATSADAGAIGLFQNSLLASLTPVDLFEVAVGPSLDYAGIAAASVDTSGGGSGAASNNNAMFHVKQCGKCPAKRGLKGV